MNELHNIERYYQVIDNSLFTDHEYMLKTYGRAPLDYDRATDAIIKLANAVHAYANDMSDDGYEVWDIGEGGISTVSDLIVGAFWHYTEWHGGQWSKGYAALSALGQVFSPGMSGPETDNEAYLALNDMAA